uniref:Uncharacterized protein n=1 Tax=Oryza punctata TaxID=4537 RepID=A0A0E0M1U5_ORYPU
MAGLGVSVSHGVTLSKIPLAGSGYYKKEQCCAIVLALANPAAVTITNINCGQEGGGAGGTWGEVAAGGRGAEPVN